MIHMRSWEFYQVANGLKRLNRWIQVILIFSLILGLNHLGMKHFMRYDLTGNNRFTLSPETRAYLQEIRDPIHIIVTIPENSPRQEEQILYRYIHRLLQEYAYLSRSGGEFLITTEFVDIYKDLSRADFLAREHGLNQINSLLVLSKERRRLVRADELVTFRDRKPEAYKGEATITSAIMEVSQEKSPKLYFLTGHQETDPGDTSPQNGLSQISRELEMRNFTLGKLDLTAVPKVPEDTAILIIADPKGPLLPSEVEKIRTYLFDRAGRMLLWIRPGVESGMEPLLAEWGLYLPDQVVIEPNPQFRESSGTLLIRNFGEHEISQSLIQNQTYVVSGLARPVIPRPPSPADERLHLTALFASSKTSWGESAYRSGGEPVFNEERDFPALCPSPWWPKEKPLPSWESRCPEAGWSFSDRPTSSPIRGSCPWGISPLFSTPSTGCSTGIACS